MSGFHHHTYYSDMVNRRTCVYRFFNADGDLLYVGISMNLMGRLAKHRQRVWWPEVDDITVQWFPSRELAKDAERDAIIAESPRYNRTRPIAPVMWREVGA